MIFLKMGGEPKALRDERKSRMVAALAAFNAYGHGSEQLKETLTGYGVVKEILRERQHGKCAFCERAEDAFNQPVEHFRPKAAADDFTGVVGKEWGNRVTSHYWWLTWTWSNLFFACDDCNRIGRKGNRFPIEAGKARFLAPTAPLAEVKKSHMAVASEPAMLINPRLDDPFEHLEWVPVNRRLPKRSWTWQLMHKTRRGELTVLAIDLKYRADEVNRHLRLLLNGWRPVEDAIRAGNVALARTYWRGLVKSYLKDRTQPFRNAAWCALDALCPEAQRQQLGFPPLLKPTG